MGRSGKRWDEVEGGGRKRKEVRRLEKVGRVEKKWEELGEVGENRRGGKK